MHNVTENSYSAPWADFESFFYLNSLLSGHIPNVSFDRKRMTFAGALIFITENRITLPIFL